MVDEGMEEAETANNDVLVVLVIDIAVLLLEISAHDVL